jgi:hypothetical protein
MPPRPVRYVPLWRRTKTNAQMPFLLVNQLVLWRWPGDARLADLFQGDEIGNAAHLDLGKVQMLFFTLILVLAYGVALANLFTKATPIVMLPALDGGMVALLGISHAGYLLNKAVPHSEPSSVAAPAAAASEPPSIA